MGEKIITAGSFLAKTTKYFLSAPAYKYAPIKIFHNQNK